jgi:hypothetical protein
MALSDTRNVAVEVLMCERKLIGIELFRTASKLRALQLLDDELKAFDLAIAVLNDSGHIAHKMLQKSRFGGQIVEIDSHVRFYVNARIGPSNFPANNRFFSFLSPGQKWAPEAFRCATCRDRTLTWGWV